MTARRHGSPARKRGDDGLSLATVPQIVRSLGSDVPEQIQIDTAENPPGIIAVAVIIEPSCPDAKFIEHALTDIQG